MNFSEIEQKELNENAAYKSIKMFRSKAKEYFSKIIKHFPSFQDGFGDFQKFLDFQQHSKTRSFSGISNGQKQVYMMPLIDQINHSTDNWNLRYSYDTNTKEFYLSTREGVSIEIDQEAFITYRGEDDSNFKNCFGSYGFVDQPGQMNSQMIVYVGLDIDCVLYKEKLNLIENLFSVKDLPEIFDLKLDSRFNTKFVRNGFGALRQIVLDNKSDLVHFTKYQEVKQDEDKLIPFLSVWNELLVLKKIKDACLEEQATKYTTTLEQDQKFLESDEFENGKPLSLNMRNIIQYRVKQKLLLKWFMDFSDTISEFYNKYRYFEMREMRYEEPYKQYKSYFDMYKLYFVNIKS